jgi:hypothetical protein
MARNSRASQGRSGLERCVASPSPFCQRRPAPSRIPEARDSSTARTAYRLMILPLLPPRRRTEPSRAVAVMQRCIRLKEGAHGRLEHIPIAWNRRLGFDNNGCDQPRCRMPAPLSMDLRLRIVRVVERGSSIRAAAQRVAVSPSAAIKLMQRVGATGSAAPALWRLPPAAARAPRSRPATCARHNAERPPLLAPVARRRDAGNRRVL